MRTRNLLLSEHVAKALKQAEAVGGVADFAFLSDRKLLNTAMTRTMSMVAVVGDPVALCGIGECIQIWRTFLKHCHNMRSIRPVNINYDNIKSEVCNQCNRGAARTANMFLFESVFDSGCRLDLDSNTVNCCVENHADVSYINNMARHRDVHYSESGWSLLS